MSGGWSSFFSYQAPKYHGLVNQGATCYLNSVLQVLFMTKDFRDAVERNADGNPDTIDRHLNSLFSDLQQYPAYTYNITTALGINRVYEQRDAAEYIEKILQLTSNGASQIFHGLLSQRTTCCKCGAETDRDEAFWHLPLPLVDSCSDTYSVVDGIRDFFKVSSFSGETQIYCDTCDDKVDAEAQYVMKHHPDVLILLLKRFEFSYHYMSYVKINHLVDVPSIIEMPESQTYKLYAVVDHSGDLRGGHYTATIKDEDEDRWYHFNDRSVTPYDSQPFQKGNTEKSCTAQLLFYRKEEAVIQDNMSNNKCEDAENTRQRYAGEDDVEMGDLTEAVSVGENDVTGNEGKVRDVSRRVGQSEEPETEGIVRQNWTHKNQEDNEDGTCHDASFITQKIEEGTQRGDDEEIMRGKDQRPDARLLSVGIKQTESIKNETSDSDKETNLNANFKPEVSDWHETRVYLNQQDETNDAQSRVTDKDEKTEDEESEKSPMDNFSRDAEHLSKSGFDKRNRNEDQGSNQKTSKHSSAEFFGVEEKDNVKNAEEGFGQENVTKLAKEEEETRDSVQFHNREDSVGTVRGERENQEEGSEQRLNANFKPEVSDRHETRLYLNQHDETNDAQSRVIDRDDKQPQKPPMDNFNRDAEYLSEGRLEKQNRNEGQDSNLMTRQQFDSGRKKYVGNENPDSGSLQDARPNMSKNPSVELVCVVEEGNVKTLKYKVKTGKLGSCKDGTVGNSTRSKAFDNQEFKRDFSEPLGRHVEDKRGENIDSKRDGGHDQRRGSARKGSEGGTGKDRRRLDGGIRQKNVKERAEEKEEKGEAARFHKREDSAQVGTVRRERENQERSSGQKSVLNKGQDNQPGVESVQHSDKDTGPAKTNKRKRPGSSILRLFKVKKTKTEEAGETSNSSHHDQNTHSLTEGVSNLVLTELAVPSQAKSNKRKGWRVKKTSWKKWGKVKEKKNLKEKKERKKEKHRTPGCFSGFKKLSKRSKRVQHSTDV